MEDERRLSLCGLGVTARSLVRTRMPAASKEPPQLSAAAALPSLRLLPRSRQLSPRHHHALPTGRGFVWRDWLAPVEGQAHTSTA